MDDRLQRIIDNINDHLETDSTKEEALRHILDIANGVSH